MTHHSLVFVLILVHITPFYDERIYQIVDLELIQIDSFNLKLR